MHVSQLHSIPLLNSSSILLQNSDSEFPPHSLKKSGWPWGRWVHQLRLVCHKTGQLILEILPINIKVIHGTPET